MGVLLLYLIGGFFVLYHIIGQPRLIQKAGDIGSRTIFYFAGCLLALGLSWIYMYLTVTGDFQFMDIAAIFPQYLVLFTGCILAVFDLIILIYRYSNRLPELPTVNQTEGLDPKVADELKKRIDELERESKILQSENETLKESSSNASKQENEFYRLSNDLKLKEDAFSQQKKEWEQEYRQKDIQASERYKQKEAKLEKDFSDKITDEKERLQESYHHKMTEFVDSITEKLEKRIHNEKKNLVDDIFSFDAPTSDHIFELRKTKESLEKEKEAFEKNKFLLEVDDKVSKSKEHVLEAKNSALDVKSENLELRTELKLIANEFKNEMTVERSSREKSVDAIAHKLELEEERRKSDTKDVGNKISLLAEQTKGQLIELASVMNENLKDLEMRTMDSFREVRENLSDMKLQFGQEILRLDGQQGQILNELEKYYIKNQEFVNKCQSLALEARNQNIEGNNLLNQVNHMYSQHKLETKAMENQLQTSLDQIAVKEGHLANSIGESMLKLKNISDQQYIAAKDMALEKKDMGLLWREKNIEHDMNLQEVRHQKQDFERLQQFANQSINDKVENSRLHHQLYMNEHRFMDALKKAQNSQSLLGKLARAADYAFNKS